MRLPKPLNQFSIGKMRESYFIVLRSRSCLWIYLFIVTLAGQFVEYSLRDENFHNMTTVDFSRRFVVPVITVYSLFCTQALTKTIQNTLRQIRPSVLISDDDFSREVKRISTVRKSERLILLLISFAKILLFFVPRKLTLPMSFGMNVLPDNIAAATLIIATYTVFGWALLLLIFSTIKFSRGISSLSQKQLLINVFDMTNLLPLGRFSLIQSGVIGGIVILLIVPLGRPTLPIEYMVIALLTLGSSMALFLPLLSVHNQIKSRKQKCS